jgi:hypothetical protein
LFATVTVEQLSLAVGVPKVTPVAVHPEFVKAVTVAGAIIVGFVLSTTVTNCVVVEEFPEASVTVQVTVVLPSVNTEGALFVTEATEQLSAVVGTPKLTLNAEHVPLAFTVTAAGAVIVGVMLSNTVTV